MTRSSLWLWPLVSLAGLGASSCTWGDADVPSYLNVKTAEKQPESPTLGTLALIQQRGGKFLRLKTVGGTFELSTDAPGTARAQACITAPLDDVMLPLNVAPAETECELFVDLVGPGATADAAPCSGPTQQSAVAVITTKRQNSAEGNGGGGGSGGASGSSSASSSGSGGASGSSSGSGGMGGSGGTGGGP